MRRFVVFVLLTFLSVSVLFAQDASLQVTEVLPDTDDVAGDAVITVVFNRPVVPLVSVADMDKLPDPLTISPQILGDGEWLNTSIYVFRPAEVWAGGTTYTVTVDVEAADGSVLAEPYEWSFTTTLPALVSVVPEEATGDVRLNSKIQMTFNMAIDKQSLETNFYMRPIDDATGTISGSFKWSDDVNDMQGSVGVAFTPDDLLAIDTVYVIGFPANAVMDAAGGAMLPAAQWTIATVPYPAIIGSSPFDGAVDVNPYGSAALYFVSPMDGESFKGLISIDPKPWREPEYYYRTWNDELSISFPTEPSTDYTIHVAPGGEDVYGNTIDTPFSFSFRTAPYSPDLNLQVPGYIGFYNAYRDQTELFITHRNVSRLDLSLYQVPVKVFVGQIAGEDYWDPTEGYRPSGSDLLRQWQIPSTAPENAQRYDLLNLAGGDNASFGGLVECTGSLPARVKVGDTAIVITEPDPLRARSSAPDGEIVDLLYRDYVIPIVGGPVCFNEILWWEVELRDDTTAWIAESIGEEYFIDVRTAAQTSDVVVSTDAFNDGALVPGIYYLEVASPETRTRGWTPARHFLMVSTANLTVKTTVDTMMVWATDVNTGQPIQDAPINIYDEKFNVVGSGVTDSNGLAQIAMTHISDLYIARVAVLDTADHFGAASSVWSDGIDPYRFGVPSTFYPQQYSLYMYTDRPVYRPDQPVHFRGVLRDKDDVNYTLTDFDTVPVQIYDNEGQIIYDEQLPLTEFGTFSDTFMLADDTPLGFYRIEVSLPAERYRNEGGSVFFNVAEYRLPEFQVEVVPQLEAVVQGDLIRVDVAGRYFFGGVVSDANVEYNVIAEPYSFNYQGPGRYDFVDYNPDGGPGEIYGFDGGLIASGTGITDSNGQFIIEVPADLENVTQSYEFQIEAVVRDESDQTVAGRSSVIVHQGNVYIGTHPRDYVGQSGEASTIDFVAVDWDSAAIEGQELQIEIVERRWSSIQEQDPSGRTVWTWEVEELPVEAGEVRTDEQGKSEYTFVPPNGGIFKIIAVTQDDRGNEVRSSTTMWVSSREYVSWRQQNSNRIDLIIGQDSYQIGDTAEILITSPFQGETEALITVERGSVLQTERVTMDSNSYVYSLPIVPEFSPNVFVNVLLIKGVDETNPVAGFRMGLAELQIDNKQQEITIDIVPDVEQAGPGDVVTYTVRTTDYEGNPLSSEVGVGLTDLASLSLADPNTGPILDFFYGRQPVSIRTSTPLTINTDQLTQTVLDTIKGGGGGFGEGGIFDIREDFIDTAYWNGHVVTDENGVATFDVTLPDNLTTWRLDARAVTIGGNERMLVGQDTFDLLSTKPVLIRPVTPRFFVIDDVVQLAAVVNNNTDEELTVNVTLQAKGIIFNDDALETQEIVIPAGNRQRVTWMVTVDDVEHVELIFSAVDKGGRYDDASRPILGLGEDRLLPVYRYEVPEVVGTGGVIRDADTITETILIPDGTTQGELTINVEPSLAATSLEALEYLEYFPYHCTEQTVSRFLPNVMTYRALVQTGHSDPVLEANLSANVQLAVQRLYVGQKVDGSWGWFVQDSGNSLVTAYAVIGLSEALNSGFAIDQNVIARAQAYLRNQFIVPGLNAETWKMDRQAFILYALARSGTPDVGRSVALYEHRERLSIYSKALLAITLDMAGTSDSSRVETLISDIFNRAITSANGTHWEEGGRDYWNWNTDTRTTAMVLQALIRFRPDSDLIPNVVRWLMVARTADAWETTQETAWSVMALADWMVVSGELQADYAYDVTMNDNGLLSGRATTDTIMDSEVLIVEVADMLLDEANRLTLSRTEGTGNLYYTAYMRNFLPVPQIESLNRGIIIERHYTLLGDKNREPITEAHIGELVQVHLTIIAPNNLHYVVINDPIPAGTDAVNPGLNTSQQIGTRPGLDYSDPVSRGWGWWWFSNIEFHDEKVVLNSSYLPAGTYEYVYTIRPGLEGVYNVIPATGQEFYFPDVYGRSSGSVFTVLPAK